MASSSSTATSGGRRWQDLGTLANAAGRWLFAIAGRGGKYIQIGLSIMMSLMPAAGASRVLGWAIPGKPLLIQIPLLVVSFGLLAWLVWGISTERGRSFLIGDSIAYHKAFVAAVFVLFFSFACFAALTCFLLERGWLEITPNVAHDRDGVAMMMDFYLWHVLDAIPLADVTETIRWKQPYTYHDSLSGLILLIFKVGIIIPVLRTFTFGKQALAETALADSPD